MASARQDSDRRRQRTRGLLHWKVEMAGREIAEDVGPGPYDEPRMHFKLFPENEVPLGMVRIASLPRLSTFLYRASNILQTLTSPTTGSIATR